jgi:leucyl/phenylalanyl-tRNA--protein transferase
LAYHADHTPVSAQTGAPEDRRDALFRESVVDIAQRWALGLAWELTPKRIAGVPGLARLCFNELLAPDHALPDPEHALANPPGLAGIVHELTLPILFAAYRRGLYPLAHIAPLKWWSPPLRSVLAFKDFHMSNNLRRLMRQDRYTVTFDRDFESVIVACAGRRQGRWHLTWITPRIMRVYADAFDAGHAHSYEVWNKAGELIGGGYGIGYGAGFTGESQFAHEPNASKVGLAVLSWHLAKWGFLFFDGKLIGPLWASMGCREIPRQDYLARLAQAVRLPGKIGRWQVETDLDAVSHWQPADGAGN